MQKNLQKANVSPRREAGDPLNTSKFACRIMQGEENCQNPKAPGNGSANCSKAKPEESAVAR
jgi:hypothetical protein